MDHYHWSYAIEDYPCTEWVWAYTKYLEDDALKEDKDWERIKEEEIDDTELVPADSLSFLYDKCFGYSDVVGWSYEIDIGFMLDYPERNRELMSEMSGADFPLYQEYRNVKEYFSKLKARVEKKRKAKSLFDD